jgi:hypothetical protein
MSAFVVDKSLIDLLVAAADHYGRRGGGSRMQWWQTDEQGGYAGWRYLWPAEDEDDSHYTASQVGQMLVDENVRSVHHRYSDTDPDRGDLPGPVDAYYMGPYVYEPPGRVLSPGEVFAAIDCLDYQSCEHDEWRSSEAHAFLESLREAACRHVDGYARSNF